MDIFSQNFQKLLCKERKRKNRLADATLKNCEKHKHSTKLLYAESTGKGLKSLIRGSCAHRCQKMKIKVENVFTSVAKCFMKIYRFCFS